MGHVSTRNDSFSFLICDGEQYTGKWTTCQYTSGSFRNQNRHRPAGKADRPSVLSRQHGLAGILLWHSRQCALRESRRPCLSEGLNPPDQKTDDFLQRPLPRRLQLHGAALCPPAQRPEHARAMHPERCAQNMKRPARSILLQPFDSLPREKPPPGPAKQGACRRSVHPFPSVKNI